MDAFCLFVWQQASQLTVMTDVHLPPQSTEYVCVD